MTRLTDTPTNAAAPSSILPTDISAEGHVCPFCGLTREITAEFDPSTPCPRCTLSDNPNTRNATKARVGPWYVRQVRNPWAPGMRFETLLALVKRRQVTRDSIVRGPTTHQLWKRAAEVKGLSREFGICYSCSGEIDTQSNLCPHCNRLQEPPANPDVLVETRECASVPPSLQPTPQPAHQPNVNVNLKPPQQLDRPIVSAEVPPLPPMPGLSAIDEPPHIEMSTHPLPDPDEMLSATDDQLELARKLTARPPVRQPGAPRGDRRPPAPPPPTQSMPAAAAAAAPTPAAAPSNAASANEKSASATPPRPPRTNLRPHRPGGPDDALLTPAELATAFQLDFKPEDQPVRRSRKGIVVLVLFLLVIGAGVLLYLRPDWRKQGTEWSLRQYATVKAYIDAQTGHKSSATTRPATLTLQPMPTVPASPHQPITIVPPAAASAAPTTRPTVAISDEPIAPKPSEAKVATDIEPAPAVVAPPTPMAPPPPVNLPPPPPVPSATKTRTPDPLLPAPAAVPVPATQPSPAPVQEVATPAVPAEAPKPTEPQLPPYELSKQLWGKAIDAEINQDYVEAVRCYKEIEKLPAEYHQNDLELRLARASRLAK